MSSPEVTVPKKKLPLLQLAVVGGVGAVVLAGLVYFLGWQTVLSEALRLKTELMAWVSGAGPGVFFGAMAVLPAVGFPMSPFALAAGPLFAERMGFVTVALCGIAAITFNLTVTYWLARRWLRPWLTRFLTRNGYALPVVESGDVTDLIVLLRVTPGLPFLVQNYLLGLGRSAVWALPRDLVRRAVDVQYRVYVFRRRAEPGARQNGAPRHHGARGADGGHAFAAETFWEKESGADGRAL
jgi:uncharacterized membrane protein YdjX (TVP38/TMEM64 family)